MTSRSSSLILAGWPDQSPDIFPALITRPASASIRCSSLAFQIPRWAAARRRFHFMTPPAGSGGRGGCPPHDALGRRRVIMAAGPAGAGRRVPAGDPGVLDVGGVDVNVIHGRGEPGVAEGLLDRDQVHPAQVELRGAEMPQD